MNNRKLAAIVSQVAMILIVIICALTCAFTQTIGSPLGAYNVKIADNEKQQTPPSNEPDFAWNNSKYFRSYDYIKAPDKRFFDWKSYTVTWDGKQAAIWGLYALSGVAHGIREAYHADPYLFERRNGVEPTSFWGSDSWKRNYYHNDPDGHHKREFFGNVGRDVWHTFNQVDLVPLGISIAASAKRKHPLKYQIANTLVGLGLRVLFVNITYATLRNTR